MSHQDRTSKIVVNHQTIKQVVDQLVPARLFIGMKVRQGSLWKPRLLAVAALLWACSDLSTLKERFHHARKIVNRIFRWENAVGETWQGFIKMLRKWHDELMLAIVVHLRQQMEGDLSGHWTIGGYTVFAGDGSRLEMARTRRIERAYSATKKRKQARKRKGKNKQRAKTFAKKRTQSAASVKKKANTPQMWLTLLWHVGTGLPWAWKTGPSDSSERAHVQAMLVDLPENSVITADAGFVGYDFWKDILNSEHHFVARVGGNVSLLKNLGYARQYEHTVYLWPDCVAKKNQEPLVLRLIVIHDGRQPVYLVTDLTRSQLSDRQGAELYAKRWGIELFFRTLKQTFGRSKLRSHSPETARLEADWSLLAVWCVCLLGQKELLASGNSPTQLSPATAIRAFQATLRDWRVRPETVDENLWKSLRNAILDEYNRTSKKASRDYPRKKKRERITAPKINNATRQQIKNAKQLTANKT